MRGLDAATPRIVARSHVFDPHVEVAERWLKEVAHQLGLPPGDTPRALRALRAGLHALRDRLPAGEVVDLGAQLPVLLRGIYYEGWSLVPRRIRDRAAVIGRIQAELAPDPRLAPLAVLRVVIHQLVTHVSAGEIADVLATLPRPIAALWQELHPTPRASPTVSAPRQVRRTGYSR